MSGYKNRDFILELSNSEFESFKKFVEFNNGKTATKLLVIIDLARNKKTNFEDKQLVYKAIYPNKPFSEALLRKLLFTLTRSIEDYMVYTYTKHHEFTYNDILLEAFQANQDYRNFDSTYKKAQKKLINSTPQGYHYYRFKTQLKRHNTIRKGNQALLDEREQQIIEYFRSYYEHTLLEECIYLFNLYIQASDDNVKKLTNWWRNIKSLYDYWGNFDNASLRVMYQTIEYLADGASNNTLNELEDNLFNSAEYIDERVKRRVQVLLSNAYFDQKIEEYELLDRLHRLDRYAADNGIITTTNNTIDPLEFMNVVTVGYRLKEFLWTDEFIEKYASCMSEGAKKWGNILEYVSIVKAFEKGNYHKANDGFLTLAIYDFTGQAQARRLKLKTLFELKEYDQLEDNIASFRKWLSIQKNSLPESALAGNRLFISYLLRTYKYLTYPNVNDNPIDEIKAFDFLQLYERNYLLSVLNKT